MMLIKKIKFKFKKFSKIKINSVKIKNLLLINFILKILKKNWKNLEIKFIIIKRFLRKKKKKL